MSDFKFPDGDLRGWKVRTLIRAGKVTAEQVAHKLNTRARILRDIAPVVSVSGPGIPAIRGRNLEWAADELEIAGETIVALASSAPRTAQDMLNEENLASAVVALRVVGGSIVPVRETDPPSGFVRWEPVDARALSARLSALEEVAEAAREVWQAAEVLAPNGDACVSGRNLGALRDALAGLGADTQESGV